MEKIQQEEAIKLYRELMKDLRDAASTGLDMSLGDPLAGRALAALETIIDALPNKLRSFMDTEQEQELKKEIKCVINDLADRFDQELFAKKQEELEEYWHFKWDAGKSVDSNMYQFYDLLRLYSGQCRRWEEHHGGICCVVERVRDKYIFPKIKAFVADLKAHFEIYLKFND